MGRTTHVCPLQPSQGGVVMISSGLAYVPWSAAPVYCATKSFLHFFTRSLRRQLEPHGVGVFEVLPPVVATDMAANMDEGAMKKITPDELARQALNGARRGQGEIPVGMAKQMRMMSRLAPSFLEGQLAKMEM